MIRSLEVSKGPDLSRMSAAQRTTFNYYVGLLAFEEEDYDKVRSTPPHPIRAWKYHPDTCSVDALHGSL